MKCINCGVNIGDEAQFCPYCGQTVQTASNDNLNVNSNTSNQSDFSNGGVPNYPLSPDAEPIQMPMLTGGIGNNPLFQSTKFDVASPIQNSDIQTENGNSSNLNDVQNNTTSDAMIAEGVESSVVLSTASPEVKNNHKNNNSLIIAIILMLLCGIVFIGFTIFTNWK